MIEFLLYRYDLISEEWLPLNNSVNAVEMRYGHSLALHKVSSVFQTHFPADFPFSPASHSLSQISLALGEAFLIQRLVHA